MNLGPTAYQAALDEYDKCGTKIKELEKRRKSAYQRILKYRHSSMLESERLATKAEPYQQISLEKNMEK